MVAHCSDGSGTTFIFSDYSYQSVGILGKKHWNSKSLNLPVGLGGKGNQGVAGLVQQTPAYSLCRTCVFKGK